MLLFDDRYRNAHRFCESDAFYLLFLLKHYGVLGVGSLAERLDLGRASTRSLIHLMIEDGLVTYDHKGASITDLGRSVFRAVTVTPLDIHVGPVIGTFSEAVKIHGMADQITTGLQQVKIATMMGAIGCTTWVVERGRLVMPPHRIYDTVNHRRYERIIAEAGLDEGDVVLECGADNRRTARNAAIYAAMDLY